MACLLCQFSTSWRCGKDAKIRVCLACGASTSSAPASILTGADEERIRVGVVGGNWAGSLWHSWLAGIHIFVFQNFVSSKIFHSPSVVTSLWDTLPDLAPLFLVYTHRILSSCHAVTLSPHYQGNRHVNRCANHLISQRSYNSLSWNDLIHSAGVASVYIDCF